MSLTKNEFKILHALSKTGNTLTRRQIAQETGLALGTVSSVARGLEADGKMLDGRITETGISALEPYRIDNAVIMAAGLSSRFVPLSYERPKGMLRVKGEILIERQIEQLLERGISDITIVVGYKKEYFFYLVAKYGVKIVVNDLYAERNNSWTLWLVRDQLRNTYVCSSDDYFTVNPFERYVYKAYYASVYAKGETTEWCIGTGSGGRITKLSVGGRDSWIMLGHAYFDRAFSDRFVRLLGDVIERPDTYGRLWEDVYATNLNLLDMEIRQYDDGVIWEFDSLAELEDFDPDFISNVDSEIFDNIERVLGCKREEISCFYPMSQGITNLSCHFTVGGNEYVYRHPGVGTEKLINRKTEVAANTAARSIGVDRTFMYEDDERGWKICHFIPNARTLDPSSPTDVKRAMELCRRIHESDVELDTVFDFFENGVGYEKALAEHGVIDIPGYFELREKVARLNELSKCDGYGLCFSHNDYLQFNILFDDEGELSIIDWEYAGMSDPMNDVATYVVCSEADERLAEQALAFYLGKRPTSRELRHFWSRVVLAGWCWYVWALVKEAEGAGVGEWLYIYYRYAAQYVDEALRRYEGVAE